MCFFSQETSGSVATSSHEDSCFLYRSFCTLWKRSYFISLLLRFFMGVLITTFIKEGKNVSFSFVSLTHLSKKENNVFSFSFVEVFFPLLYIVAFDKDDALPMINERHGT